jgi:Beta-ketoacyl synthase, N-terminal domain
MTRLAAQIEGIGILGPGLESWPGALALLEGRSPYNSQPTVLPVPEGLPPAERRRLGRVVKLALAVGLEATSRAGADPATLPAVFASSGGDGHNCHEICQALSLADRLISPTRFHNSVHNAAAGYWSIATGSQAASNALCAFDASFAAGLLEAVVQVVLERRQVLLVAYDAQYPPPLFAKRPIPEAFGVAFVLGPASAETPAPRLGPAPLARLTVAFSDSPADRMADPAFESLRGSIPAARSLPLLYQLATRQAAVVHIEYLDGRSLAVEVEPCI